MDYGINETMISVHGLGFIQIKMPNGLRLHVYHPDVPKRKNWQETGIHDHRFGFNSTILVGRLLNTNYKEVPGNQYTIYGHEGERLATGQRAWNKLGECDLDVDDDFITSAGGEYSMQPYIPHMTYPQGNKKCVTLIRKWPYGKVAARNFGFRWAEPDTSFDRNQMNIGHAFELMQDCFESPQ